MAIELKNISKSFGGVHALSDVSLTFGGGKIYGLLGPNGAGKTTLLNIITNRLYADSGEVTIDGEAAPGRDRALGKVYMMVAIAILPVIIVYLLLSKFIVRGVALGGVKG